VKSGRGTAEVKAGDLVEWIAKEAILKVYLHEIFDFLFFHQKHAPCRLILTLDNFFM
jgi:hypothetical protein